MPHPAYRIRWPGKTVTTCVVFASPHSGRDFPQGFFRRVRLDVRALRTSEDAYVDRLFGDAPDMGAPLLLAGMSRSVVDLNRSSNDLDPALVEGVRKSGYNPRVAGGLGVIPRVVANGCRIYSDKLSREEAQTRLNQCWYPYHMALRELLANAHRLFGSAILVDCHSMPGEALSGFPRNHCPDIVLGDRFGASAGTDIVERIEAAFVSAGFRTARNTPFAGAYVTQAYGRPAHRQHAVQVEINRAIYMDEAAFRPLPEFDAVRDRLRQAVEGIAAIGKGIACLAAE